MKKKINDLQEAPSFSQPLSSVEVKEAESISASVRVTGAPEPHVEWFKDGQPVKACLFFSTYLLTSLSRWMDLM